MEDITSADSPLLAEAAAVAGRFDENESVRLVVPCRDGEVSNISRGCHV